MPISWNRSNPEPVAAASRPALAERLAERLAQRRQAQLWRQSRPLAWRDATTVQGPQGPLQVFCSNDYLGLAHHPALRGALQAAAAEGVGSTASALVCGYHPAHAALEEALAEWTGRERALLFSTGYLANLGVQQALLERGDLCVQDKLNHASLLDGAQLAGAELKRYPHVDVDGAARQLASRPGRAGLLVSDGVFSMDGDIAPLAALATLAQAQRVPLLIDDAHGLGVFGPRGAGVVAEAGLDQRQVPLLVGTLGKALGCAGAFVAGPADWIEAVAQFARAHIYTTAPPPALAAAARQAIGLARQDEPRQRLHALIEQFTRGARQRGLPLLPSRSPIQPLLLGSAGRALAAADWLEQRGWLVGAIRPPTVPAGSARLRITLSAAHRPTQLERLLDDLAACLHWLDRNDPAPG